MPNPFIKAGPSDTSTDTEHKGLTPIPERVKGNNHPYRGLEQHGVPDAYDPLVDPLPEYPDARDGRPVPVHFDAPEEPPDPIPVIVVNESAREIDSFRVVRSYVSGQPARVLNAKDDRRNVTIRNLDATHTIYIDSETIGTSGTAFGYPIPAGTSFQFSRLDTEVWAVSDDGTTVGVAIIWEYSQPVKER